MNIEQMTPSELADKLNGLCVAEFAWPYLNKAATELRRLAARDAQWNALIAGQAGEAVAQDAFAKALSIRTAQGWTLTGKAVPVLYTDAINGEQVCRDDLWICTTAALASLPAPQGAQAIGAPEAFQALAAALAADPGYAWSWHCAVWASAHDEGMETGAANRAAARFMHMAFAIDTSKHEHFNEEWRVAAPSPDGKAEQAEAPSDADPLTPEQEEWVMDLAEKHNLGRRVPQIGAMRGVAPDVFYTDASYRTHELFCFAAALLSTKDLT